MNSNSIIITRGRSDQRALAVSQLSGTVKKTWAGPDATLSWLQQHVDMLDVVAPDRVIDFGGIDGHIFITFRYVAGMTLREWLESVGMSDVTLTQKVWGSATKYWVDNIVETFPYAHWDWTSCNTVIVSDSCIPFQFEMIDWDKCRKSTVADIRDHLTYRLYREMAGIVQRAPQATDIVNLTVTESLAYFNQRFKNATG